jgi:hypothetical protein
MREHETRWESLPWKLPLQVALLSGILGRRGQVCFVHHCVLTVPSMSWHTGGAQLIPVDEWTKEELKF